MIDKDLLPWFRLAHGLYNSAIIALFFAQGMTGISIRRARRSGRPLPVAAARRHRKLGPVLAPLGMAGFLAGLLIVTAGERNYLEHWHHLFTGVAIVVLILLTVRIASGISGPDAPRRNTHFRIGIAILSLYVLEALLGIGILL